ncbi:MAG: FYDLN acid domain-containing protein [Deltaproteobacteria bacterium]|nr:FYDLN acid domain-containing protein [Deltaproteobacteria bacterium]
MTAATNLGKKFTCFKCECKFYDLGAEEPLCPRCGADQREDPNPDPREAFLARFRKPSRSRSRKKKKPEPKPAPKAADDGESMLDDDFDEKSDGKGKAKK